TKPVLEGLSRLLAAPKHRAAAVAALQRGGAAGVEVLMDVLAAAPTVGERRAVFDALKHMTEGTDQLVHMLEHSQWFVVRNVAEVSRARWPCRSWSRWKRKRTRRWCAS